MTNPKDHWETPQILSDLPLRPPEKAHFHFEEFAVTLARLIVDPGTHTPLTIGISGPWGSGKTTLLQRVQHLLKPAKPKERSAYLNADETPEQFRMCKTVWFDAWKYNDEEKILVALVRNILVAMKKDGLFNKLKADYEDPNQPTYDLLGLFINAFQFKFGGLGTEVQIKFDPEKHAKESPFVTHTAFFDYFDEAFSRLMALWVHNTGKEEKIEDKKGALVVFIDDLDRCLPEKTVQVLEAVKLFLDKPGCVFVLGAHTEVVQQAIVKNYADSGVSGDNASDYLEKIIQLRFELPPILENQMGDYLTTQGLPTESLDNWETIVAGAEINPRKVKTFLNDLNLAWALLVNSGQAQDVNRSDFTHWQVLMRAAPDSFRKHVYDLDNPAIRFQYIQRALAWVKEDEQAKEYFKDYEKYGRLKRTLQKIGAFSPQFDAKTLDAFIHLVAPPKPPVMEKILTEAKESPGTTQQNLGLLESQPSIGEEKFPEKILRGGTPPRAGEIWFAGMPFLPIPRGEFLLGSRENDPQAFDEEKLQHTVNISKDYWMARFPITNEQFAKFVEDNRHKHEWIKDWKKKPDHPVVNISWNAAMAYCDWLNKTSGAELPDGYIFSLPSEAEWEKAARGEFAFEYPWGNEFDPAKCNTEESKIGTTTPVGAYSDRGDSPYGCADMAGNVWEWTRSLFKPYPYEPGDVREDRQAEGSRVLRGGSFHYSSGGARCACRRRVDPRYWSSNLGFRVGVVSHIF